MLDRCLTESVFSCYIGPFAASITKVELGIF